MSVDYVTGRSSNESAFRVRICDFSIKQTIYDPAKFKQGIIVKPFRFHVRNNNKTTNHTSSSNSTANSTSAEVNQHRQNRNKNNFRSRDSNPPQNYSPSHGDRQPCNSGRARDPSGQRNRSRDTSISTNYRRPRDSRKPHNRTRNISLQRDSIRTRNTSRPRDSSRTRNRSRSIYSYNRSSKHSARDSSRYRNDHRDSDKPTGRQVTDGKNSEMRVHERKHHVQVQPDYRDTREEHRMGRYSAPSYTDVLVHNGPPILHQNDTHRLNVNALPFRPSQYTPQLNLQHGQMMYQPTYSVPQGSQVYYQH